MLVLHRNQQISIIIKLKYVYIEIYAL